MTFASRRARIYDNEDIKKILNDDDYELMGENDVLPGDIIIYYSERGDAEHSGIVVSKPERIGRLFLPKVLSKWGNFEEVIHQVNECPYDCRFVKYYRVKK